MSNLPKVSIIVPVYNVEKYLRKCIDSILSQTLKEIEVICVNDGSTDSSLQILKEYAEKDSRIVIINKENAGYGHSMNRGLSKATGEYIGIVESDDFIEPNMFEIFYKAIKNNDCDVVKSDYYEYWGEENKIIKKNLIKKEKANKIINPKEDSYPLTLKQTIWSAIYNREFLLKNNINFLETPGASFQDISFQFKAFACAEKIMLLEEAFIYYRQDNLNASVKNKDKVYCVCNEYKEIEEFLNKNEELKEYFVNIKNINKFGTYGWNLRRIDKKFHKEFISFSSKDLKQNYVDGEIKAEDIILKERVKFFFINKLSETLLFLCPNAFFKK